MTPKLVGLLCIAPLFLASCAAIERQEIGDRENTLAAAGFMVQPANTSARMAMLSRLPSNRIYQRIEGDHVSYLYADPVYCQCLYVGSEAAFGRYQQIAIQQRIARDQLEAAQLNDQFGWGWGPWGGYGPAFY